VFPPVDPKPVERAPGLPRVPAGLKLLQEGYLDSLHVTDTHVNAYKFNHPAYHVRSVAGLIAKSVKRMTQFI
jgi:hypothetical protein